ncbi:GIY-YIG nuclease family protein [Ferruginivarius sediminum]|uniref:GIY-YIG nuclease family protein n=1 Tax=Ferruginivarius sediminum TaxID=2661937 RepID=A0A369T761_9PROT|nr:GIY-YIG nuclease family protein [Ferruginivarius sediminum]RDD60702.1 GIY-YIG nuclease family protein [Ferruginivarius sediminum]
MRTGGDSGNIPASPGAYALVLRLRASLPLSDIRRFRDCTLPPGLYAYFGSAKGAGGLAARVGRHVRLRAGRRPHWHIDRLLARGEVVGVVVWPEGDECTWRAGVQADRRVSVPLPGFGSSDCRACPAHLLTVPDAAVVADALEGRGVGGTGCAA